MIRIKDENGVIKTSFLDFDLNPYQSPTTIPRKKNWTFKRRRRVFNYYVGLACGVVIIIWTIRWVVEFLLACIGVHLG